MYLMRNSITVLAGTSKGDVEYSGTPINGLLHSITYSSSTGTGLSSTATIAFATEVTGKTLFSGSVSAAGWTKCPRERFVLTSTGGAINPTSAASTSSNLAVKMPIVRERIKITLSETSAVSQTGTFYLFTEGGNG